jgi:hypothetical protein
VRISRIVSWLVVTQIGSRICGGRFCVGAGGSEEVSKRLVTQGGMVISGFGDCVWSVFSG